MQASADLPVAAGERQREPVGTQEENGAGVERAAGRLELRPSHAGAPRRRHRSTHPSAQAHPRPHRIPCPSARTPASRRPPPAPPPPREQSRPARSSPATRRRPPPRRRHRRRAAMLFDQRPRRVLEHPRPFDDPESPSSSRTTAAVAYRPRALPQGRIAPPRKRRRPRPRSACGIRVHPQADVVLPGAAGVALIQPADRRRSDRQPERGAAIGDRVPPMGSPPARTSIAAAGSPIVTGPRAASRGDGPTRGVRRQSSLDATEAVRRAVRTPRASRIDRMVAPIQPFGGRDHRVQHRRRELRDRPRRRRALGHHEPVARELASCPITTGSASPTPNARMWGCPGSSGP